MDLLVSRPFPTGRNKRSVGPKRGSEVWKWMHQFLSIDWTWNLALSPGLPRLQILITCSVHCIFWVCYRRSKAGAGKGLGTRQLEISRSHKSDHILIWNLHCHICHPMPSHSSFESRQNQDWKTGSSHSSLPIIPIFQFLLLTSCFSLPRICEDGDVRLKSTATECELTS